jgi:hypothetical protein
MEKALKLGALEKKAYLMYHGDGLADLAIGLVVLLFGLGMEFDQTLLAPIFAAVAYPLWLGAKKGITEKRLGYVEFSEERKSKERRGMIILFLLGSVTFLLGILGYVALTGGGAASGLLQRSGYLLLGAMFAVLISSVGLVLGMVRLHAYSAMIILSVSLANLFGYSREMGIIVPGVLTVSSGTWILASFLRRYPVSEGSGSEDVGES